MRKEQEVAAVIAKSSFSKTAASMRKISSLRKVESVTAERGVMVRG